MRLSTTLIFLFLTAVFAFSQSYKDITFTNYFKMDGNGWNASDGTSSVALPDGKTLWMFGDSHINQGVDGDNQLLCLFNSRNCIMIQDSNNNFTTYYDESGTDIYTRQFIKMEGDNQVTYWPGGGFVEDNIAYLFWNRYYKNEDAPLGIEFAGMVIAEVQYPTIELINITPLDNTNIEYGMAVVRDVADGYYYIYGRKNEESFDKPVVARCPLGDIYTNWEYYKGDNMWSDNPDDHQAIGEVVSTEFAVFQHNQKYYLLTQELGFLECGEGRDIYIYESEDPQGPFENGVIVYTVEDKFDGEYPKTYNAQAHPQFIENGELLISYNVNKTCPDPCATLPDNTTYNADMYRPKFARVPLSMFVNTSIQQSDWQNIALYPNPTTDMVVFDMESDNTVNYLIFNIQGRKVGQGVLKDVNILDMSHFSSGIYSIKLFTKTTLRIAKIIKL